MSLLTALPRFARYARRHGVVAALRKSYALVMIRRAYAKAQRRDRAQQGLALDLGKDPRSLLYRMPSPVAGLELLARAGTTDWMVFQQIFVEGEYDFIGVRDDPRSIVDCGANVGYTTAWLLTRFPAARCIAVEPDPDNFALLRHNLVQFGDRVTLRNEAVWSHASALRLVRDNVLGEWGTTVRECNDGEAADVVGVDMNALIALSGTNGIDLLKMDIEGGETAVFGANPERWLDRVRACIVELHGGEARNVFLDAMRDAGFTVTERNAIAIARRTRDS
ncbi:MAG: FkbM family methyltransferase [bacterium]